MTTSVLSFLWLKYAPVMGHPQLFAVKSELPPHASYSSPNTCTLPHVSLRFACPGANGGEPGSPHTYATHSAGDGSSPSALQDHRGNSFLSFSLI